MSLLLSDGARRLELFDSGAAEAAFAPFGVVQGVHLDQVGGFDLLDDQLRYAVTLAE